MLASVLRLLVVSLLTFSMLGKGEAPKSALPAAGEKAVNDPDGRVGRVVESNGVVAVRPLGHRRWTPVVGAIPIKPGDWLRTNPRGANAVALRLDSQANVTLGPGTLVELVSANRVRLLAGELKIAPAPDAPVELLDENGEMTRIAAAGYFRLKDGTLFAIKEPPAWLRGFEGTATQESIGSLLARVDGRDVPLTVGYHKVTVDIRDQIARTVIEESFVNHTAAQTEGVFYFPLPQDASISGFAMWIGDELVEADVVEKQRAREIYETILREKRDPALLEWTGGNLFKARVFPIFPRSEKRIKITYTQVLPLRGNRYRYSYALQSDLLRKHPLRQLDIAVNIDSAAPLAKIASPTHACRMQQTSHSARAEFTALEYTPSRDFELVVELDSKRPSVVLIPHRRGEDGYFLLQLMLPSPAGDWQREIVADGEPLDLLILADTSGSTDKSSRKQQTAFVAALLGALGPDDTFNLATCDVKARWAFDDCRKTAPENVEAAMDFLADEMSLGWSDLDAAFAEALRRAGPTTHVVYLGDGIVTGKDSDPVRFVGRLRQLYEGSPATCHAVTLGNRSEPAVVRAIGSLGGGSVRAIEGGAGDAGPAKAALGLLAEVTQPPIRDLKVRFEGLRTARVYPEQLPNLVPGTQQTLLGRYLPTEDEQRGTVTVTGQRGGETLMLRADVALADAERGNSFIPRLWARQHLDFLLDQGDSPTVREDVIALSERYHIITPYTSLLVLESDADRRRFKVARRFQMRDGEKFFAEGRDKVDYALVQKATQAAGIWRSRLREKILEEWSDWGRDSDHFQSLERHRFSSSTNDWQPSLRPVITMMDEESSVLYWGMGGGGTWGYGFGGFGMGGMGGMGGMAMGGGMGGSMGGMGGMMGGMGGMGVDSGYFDDVPTNSFAISKSFPLFGDVVDPTDDAEDYESNLTRVVGLTAPGIFSADLEIPFVHRDDELASPQFGPLMDAHFPSSLSASQYLLGFCSLGASTVRGTALAGLRRTQFDSDREGLWWIDRLFPSLPGPPEEPTETTPSPRWPPDALALARRVDARKPHLSPRQGFAVETTIERFDALRARLASRRKRLLLVSAEAWFVSEDDVNGETVSHWCDTAERGVLSKAFLLGQVRKSAKRDLAQPPLAMLSFYDASLAEIHGSLSAEVQPDEDGRAWLVLTQRRHPSRQIRVHIDTRRDVILAVEEYKDRGKLASTTRFDEFVQVDGVWRAARIERTDAQGRRQWLITRNIELLDESAFQARMNEALGIRRRVQFVRVPFPTVGAAKQAVADGTAGFDDRLALIVHRSRTAQWDQVLDQWKAVEPRIAEKPGLRWIGYALLKNARRHEELKNLIFQEGRDLASLKEPDAMLRMFLAEHIELQAFFGLADNERLEMLDILRPVHASAPAYREAMKDWTLKRISLMERLGHKAGAFALLHEAARQYPSDAGLQMQYFYALSGRGEVDQACRWLDSVLSDGRKWTDNEYEHLRLARAELLNDAGRRESYLEYLAGWIEENPELQTPYYRYLLALCEARRAEEADRIALEWMADSRREGPLPPDVLARLDAAFEYVVGTDWELDRDYVEPHLQKPLEEMILFLTSDENHFWMAEQFMDQLDYQNSDVVTRVRRKAKQVVLDRLETLPTDRLAMMAKWIAWLDPPPDERQRIAQELERRWRADADLDTVEKIESAVRTILALSIGDREWSYFPVPIVVPTQELLEFARKCHCEGPVERRPEYAESLFRELLKQPWSLAIEDEAFSLLDQQTGSTDAAERVRSYAAALHELTDEMLEKRQKLEISEIERPDQLTRTEWIERTTKAKRSAQESFADRLARYAEKLKGPMAEWATIERLTIEAEMKRDLDAVVAECWRLLGPRPAVSHEAPTRLNVLEAMLQARAMIILIKLAVEEEGKPEQVDRLIEYLDAGMVREPDIQAWKQAKYALLVALDRPEELEEALRSWIRPESVESEWRKALAYLRGEQGRLAEAVTMFEVIESTDELTGADYRTLAGWYLALDQPEKYRRAVIASYKQSSDHDLADWLKRQRQLLTTDEGNTPDELNPHVPLVFQVLLKKSNTPGSWMPELASIYRATRDPRLPAVLAEVVVGNTSGGVYSLLETMNSVTGEIHDEAAVDAILRHVEQVRGRARSPVDHRALDLLEMLIERRAAQMSDQSGPHAARALEAMRRAFAREWFDGEQPLAAELLAGMGQIADQTLAGEQRRQLKLLHDELEHGSTDRLRVACCRARAIWDAAWPADPRRDNPKRDEAIDLLTAALGERQDASGGVLGDDADRPIETLVDFHADRGQFAKAEAILLEHLKKPITPQRRDRLEEQLHDLYEVALEQGGRVSLGEGAELYRRLHDRILNYLPEGKSATPSDDPFSESTCVHRFQRLLTIADNRGIKAAREDLRRLIFTTLPEVLGRWGENSEVMLDDILDELADTVEEILGPRDALTFAITILEHSPSHWPHQYVPNHLLDCACQWRTELVDLGDLEPRLLAIVEQRLRHELRSPYPDLPSACEQSDDEFWKSKADDFARVAEEVLLERNDIGDATARIAEYFHEGLNRTDRAIEILHDARRRGILSIYNESELADYLLKAGRSDEAADVCRSLVRQCPEKIEYRGKLMHAILDSGRTDELAKIARDTETFFRGNDSWHEPVIATLATACLDTRLYAQAADYYQQAISRRLRDWPRRANDERLSEYYSRQARAYSHGKQTAKAVDAASSALVCWLPRHERRQAALILLDEILWRCDDLDAYVSQFDEMTRAEGTDSALLRRAIGNAYYHKKQYREALAQFRLARELQPNDITLYTILVNCCERVDDTLGAIDALLAHARLDRDEIELYEKAAGRFAKLGLPDQAERAVTTMVETLPNEAESHGRLAEVRQKQNRWADAADHWHEVVRIRSLEPTGLLKLAKAQIHMNQREEAATTLEQLRAREWPAHFGDVPAQVRSLEQKLEEAANAEDNR